jgi:dihydrofolate reductase
VISRQEGLQIEGVTVVSSLEQALEVGRAQEQEVFIVGGGEIYRLALPLIQKLYLTLVNATVEGDAFFPVFDWNEWVELNREERVDPLAYSFITLERKARGLV